MAKTVDEELLEKTIRATEEGLERREFGMGADAAERRIDQLQRVEHKLRNEALYMFQYDIPDERKKECPNPSWMLWHYGYRMSKSVWVITERGLKSRAMQKLLTHWKQYDDNPPRIIHYIIEYSEKEKQKLLLICAGKIQERVIELHTSLIERMDEAAKKLDEGERALKELEKQGNPITRDQRDRVEENYIGRLRGIMRDANQDFESVLACARLFDETESTATLFQGLRAAIRSVAASTNVALAIRDRKTVKAPEETDDSTNALVKAGGERYDFVKVNEEKVLVIHAQWSKPVEETEMDVRHARQFWQRLLRNEGFGREEK